MERSTVTLVLMPTTEDRYLGLLVTGCGAIAAHGGPFPSASKARDWAEKVPLVPCSHDKPGDDCLRSEYAKRELGNSTVFRLAGLSDRMGHGLWGAGMTLWRLFACDCVACTQARKTVGGLVAGLSSPAPPDPRRSLTP